MNMEELAIALPSDHLGSTSITTNSSGACTSAQWYYAYGNVRTPAPTTPCSGTVPTDFTFTGQKRDASAGLMYYNARYYDATLGRFVSADTIVPSAGDPQSLNRYAYVYNNPLKYNDPSGHCPICAGIGFVVGLTVDVGWQVGFENKPLDRIDIGRALGAGAGGAFFGGTMGAAAPATAGAAIVSGAFFGIVSGRVNIFTRASVDEILLIHGGQEFNTQRWIQEMLDYGMIDPRTIVTDATAGSISGLTGHALTKVLENAGLVNSAARTKTLGRLNKILPDNSFRFNARSKIWTIQTTVRRLDLSQSQMEQLVDLMRQGFYDLATEFIADILGKATEKGTQDPPFELESEDDL